jgi:hypothetical protein
LQIFDFPKFGFLIHASQAIAEKSYFIQLLAENAARMVTEGDQGAESFDIARI